MVRLVSRGFHEDLDELHSPVLWYDRSSEAQRGADQPSVSGQMVGAMTMWEFWTRQTRGFPRCSLVAVLCASLLCCPMPRLDEREKRLGVEGSLLA
jgi:hypothetical protein